MNYQQERDEFIALITAEGLPVHTARRVLSAANKLQRISELSCSSEAADRDRVKCPADPSRKFGKGECVCDQYHGEGQHDDVPRIDVQEAHTRALMTALLAKYGMTPDFQGDPRGCVFAIKVPSGKTNDFTSTRGICVPSRGLPASYWNRAA